jgi:hypothetical protein
MRKAKTISTDPTEAEIQHAAYLLWIEEGRPEGRDFEHWLAARELLRHRPGRELSPARRAQPNLSEKSADQHSQS